MNQVETTLSRRNLLLAVGGATAVGALLVAPFGRSVARRTGNLARSLTGTTRTLSLAHGSYELWLGLVGSVFALGDGTRMRLIGVRAFAGEGARPPELKRARAFVAAFDALGGATPAGDIIHTASHALHGSIPIFLTASRDPRRPARMLAVFN